MIENAATAKFSRESKAYRKGWEDGRFGAPGSFATSESIGVWQDLDRLAYYRGHREGKRVRETLRVRGKSA